LLDVKPMSPRPYNLENRRAASEQTRTRVLSATRELIMAGSAPLSIEAVAQQAGVARMTVYYQFHSKIGLLEALFDDLASRGLAKGLPAAYANPEPLDALTELIGVFGRFWSAERAVIRRVRGMAALDSDFDRSLSARDERRRHGLRTILGRIAEKYGRPRQDSFDETVDVLHTLTGFETFDALTAARNVDEVTALIRRLALLALGLGEATSGGV
jgi:AcrR family transcriptional regulator